jgi:hypothetical protein
LFFNIIKLCIPNRNNDKRQDEKSKHCSIFETVLPRHGRRQRRQQQQRKSIERQRQRRRAIDSADGRCGRQRRFEECDADARAAVVERHALGVRLDTHVVGVARTALGAASTRHKLTILIDALRAVDARAVGCARTSARGGVQILLTLAVAIDVVVETRAASDATSEHIAITLAFAITCTTFCTQQQQQQRVSFVKELFRRAQNTNLTIQVDMSCRR